MAEFAITFTRGQKEIAGHVLGVQRHKAKPSEFTWSWYGLAHHGMDANVEATGEQRMRDDGGPSPAAWDLVIIGGRVFDPSRRSFVRQDVAIHNGRIARLGDLVTLGAGARSIDASGLIVAPGLIDCHVHGFPLGELIGVDVDPLSSRSGATTFVDAGSTGILNFPAFREYVIDRATSNLFALLNISAIGCALHGVQGMDLWEGELPSLIDVGAAVELVEGNRDVIVGIKVRLHTGLTALAPLAAARELADEVGLPLVVHAVSPPPSFRDVLPYLRQGDVVTHIYHPAPGALVDRAGCLRDDYREARARGVLLDTGSAWMFTSFAVARAAIEQGFLPDTISSDITTLTLRRFTIDLPHILSKFLALGLSVEDVLTLATLAPARLLPPGRGFGQLAEGTPADVAILAMEEGEFQYEDKFGEQATARQRLVTKATVRAGRVLEPRDNVDLPWKYVWHW